MTDSFASTNRRRLTLKSGKGRLIANRHPWIFEGAIAKETGPEDAAIGDLVDDKGQRVASGLYSRHSQIRLRALTFGDDDLTADVITSRIIAAIRRRAPILTAGTNAARLIHAEGDELSGLVVDQYGDMLVVEISNNGLERLKPLIADTLRSELSPRLVFFKNDIPARKIEQLPLNDDSAGDGEAAGAIEEHGLHFHVDARAGQKTGFFLDQRENRQRTRELAAGKRVLNLFSYSGAFGVYAAAGGATDVENVDISVPAIDLARRNHDMNGSAAIARFTVADVFQFVRQQRDRERAGLLICDPPVFARSRGEVDRAARGYKDVNLYAMRLVEKDGLMMTFSCSGHMSLDLFQKVIFSAALDAGRRVSILQRLTAGPDHPVSLYCPEGEYLKGFLLRVGE